MNRLTCVLPADFTTQDQRLADTEKTMGLILWWCGRKGQVTEVEIMTMVERLARQCVRRGEQR